MWSALVPLAKALAPYIFGEAKDHKHSADEIRASRIGLQTALGHCLTIIDEAIREVSAPRSYIAHIPKAGLDDSERTKWAQRDRTTKFLTGLAQIQHNIEVTNSQLDELKELQKRAEIEKKSELYDKIYRQIPSVLAALKVTKESVTNIVTYLDEKLVGSTPQSVSK